MQPGGIISAIVIGLVVGLLGRLVVPGKQSIGVILTIVLGLVGSFLGAFLTYKVAGTDVGFVTVLIVQVAVTAVLLVLLTTATRRGAKR